MNTLMIPVKIATLTSAVVLPVRLDIIAEIKASIVTVSKIDTFLFT